MGSLDGGQILSEEVSAHVPAAASSLPSTQAGDSSTLVAQQNVPLSPATPAPDVGTMGDGNYVIGPNYTAAPQMATNPQVPQGKITAFTMDSSKSLYYTGMDPSLNSTGTFSRNVWLYVPQQYEKNIEAPFLIVQDGQNFFQTMAPMLNNLIQAKLLPVMLVIFISPGPGDGRGSERGLEYDTVSDTYVSFVEAEVLPKIEAENPVRLTRDPEGRATMGGSSGGAAAFTMAWFRPDLYRRVLTYSGTFVNQHPDTTYPHGAWSYHEFLIAGAAAKPLRVFLEAGQHDNNQDAQVGDGMHNWLTANDRMSDALAAKGYHYRYLYAQGASHVDGGVVAQTLPETLLWLWRGYPIP